MTRALLVSITDESTDDETRLQLRVDGERRALLTCRRGQVRLHWEVCGPQPWPEARSVMEGLLQLSLHAQRLQETAQ